MFFNRVYSCFQVMYCGVIWLKKNFIRNWTSDFLLSLILAPCCTHGRRTIIGGLVNKIDLKWAKLFGHWPTSTYCNIKHQVLENVLIMLNTTAMYGENGGFKVLHSFNYALHFAIANLLLDVNDGRLLKSAKSVLM